MITLTRKHVYKNGGASYGREGVKASIYCGPRMFSGPAPETIEFGAANAAEPDAAASEKKAAKEAKAKDRADAKAKREAERAQKKADREAKAAQKKADREAKAAQKKAAKAAEQPVEQPA